MHRKNFMSKSTKRRRLLEETADILDNFLEIPPLTSPLSVCVSNVSVNDLEDNSDSNFIERNISPASASHHSNVIKTININENILNKEINNLEKFTSDYSNCLYTVDDRSETFENFQQLDMKSDLSKWALEYNVPNNTLSGLLKVLKKHDCFSSFPSDARTIHQTNTNTPYSQPIQIKTVSPGIYHHFGLANGIQQTIDKCFSDETIKLVIGVDGLPLAKSSGSTFWPILGYIRQFHQTVFPIGIYWGLEKPGDSNIFMNDFIEEVRDLILNGITVELFNKDKQLVNLKKKIAIDAFCCDVPAKAFLLKTKGHTGFYSCSRCSVQGTFLHRRVCFPDLECSKRTHQDFLNKIQEQYHTPGHITNIINIPDIDVVQNFSIDYMHCVLLGVMKKMLMLWKGSGEIGRVGVNKQKLPSNLVKQISTRLISLKKCIPSDFSRKPRSLDELSRWKATELRQFLLYTGPVVLYLQVSKKIYYNFLYLNVAMTIFLSPNFNHIALDAQALMVNFVKQFGNLYGNHFISNNVHSLIHLYDDYEKYGSLDQVSCFKFENYMSKLKKMVRKNEKPLQQVVKRYREQCNLKFDHETTMYFNNDNIRPKFEKLHTEGPLIRDMASPQYKILILEKIIIKIHSDSDSYASVSTNGETNIIKIVNICYNSLLKKEVILGRKFETVECFFKKPIKSSDIGVYKISNYSKKVEMWNIGDLKVKYAVLPIDENVSVGTPIIHFNN